VRVELGATRLRTVRCGGEASGLRAGAEFKATRFSNGVGATESRAPITFPAHPGSCYLGLGMSMGRV
jgi:hypothetical protein